MEAYCWGLAVLDSGFGIEGLGPPSPILWWAFGTAGSSSQGLLYADPRIVISER